MALSKLVIGVVAGVISVAAIGGITAAAVTSNNNRNTISSIEESESKENENVSTTRDSGENVASNNADIDKKEMNDDSIQSSTKKDQSQTQQNGPDTNEDGLNNQDESIISMDRNKEAAATTMKTINPGEEAMRGETITRNDAPSPDSPQSKEPEIEPQVAVSMSSEDPSHSQIQEEQGKGSVPQEEGEKRVTSAPSASESTGDGIETRKSE